MNKENYSDWRLPTIKELLTLVDYGKGAPACDLKDTHHSFYWSSTTHVFNFSNAWLVNFNHGETANNSKATEFYIRCVRDGESSLEWSASSKRKMYWYEAVKYAENLKAPVYYKGINDRQQRRII